MTSAKRPRRKAKQGRARDTVAVILEAAARVLIGHGYAAATTNRIAAAAGVSVGTVYEYFANKDELFEALIRREIGALVEAIGRVEPAPDAPIDETLSRLVLTAMANVRYGPELFRSLDQVPGARFRRQLDAARQGVVEHVRHLLERSRDQLRVSDLDLAAFVVVSAAEGVGANATSDSFDARLAGELRDLLRAYLVGSQG